MRFMVIEKWSALLCIQPFGQDSPALHQLFHGSAVHFNCNPFLTNPHIPPCVISPRLTGDGDIPPLERRQDASGYAFYSYPGKVFGAFSVEVEHYNLPPGPRDCSKAILKSWRETFSISASSRMWKTLSRI